jgi:hypothetical protein
MHMHDRFHGLRAARALLCLALGVTALLATPSSASAKVERVKLTPKEDASGLVIITPFRIEEDVEPGVVERIEMTLTNDSDKAVDLTLTPTDIQAASDPRNFVEKTEDGEFGAGDWLEPELKDLRLEAWEQITFDLVINPPADAPVGTNLAGISVISATASGKVGAEEVDESTGMFRAETLIQVFLTVPGPVEHDLRILDVDVRDTFVLGSQRFVVWDVKFRNGGTVNEHVSGNLDVRSIFGNRAHREPIPENLVLRGSTRTQRVIWRDLPWVGAFTPQVRVRGDDAKLISADGERVVIFPWWLPVAIALALILPAIFLWWRRRQEWKLYVEDEEWSDTDYWDETESRI